MSTAWPSYGPNGSVVDVVANEPTLPHWSVPRTASVFGPAASWLHVHPVCVQPVHTGTSWLALGVCGSVPTRSRPVVMVVITSSAVKLSVAVPVFAAPGVALTVWMTGPVVSAENPDVVVPVFPHASVALYVTV